MPSYHITSIHIRSINLPYASPFSRHHAESSSTSSSSSSWSTLSAALSAGVQIDNQNFIGVDLYSIMVDIYYPDIYGTLQPIGILRESDISTTVDDHHNSTTKSIESKKQSSPKRKKKKNKPNKPSPFFSIQPRSTSLSSPNLVSINLTIPSSTYLQIFKDLSPWGSSSSANATSDSSVDESNNDRDSSAASSGTTNVWVSGAAHAKSPTIGGGIPITISFMCDNTLNMFLWPTTAEVMGRSCRITNLIPGWVVPLEKTALHVREESLRRYAKMAKLFDYDMDLMKPSSLLDKSMIESLSYIHSSRIDDNVGSNLTLSEIIANWYDF